MKYFLKFFLFIIFILSILSTICCAKEQDSIFRKHLYTLQYLVKQLESFKPKIISLPSASNSNSERIKVDYSERVVYIEKAHKKWEKLILDFKSDYNSCKNSNLSDDLHFCISSAYIILSQFSRDYYEDAIAETNALLKKPEIICLEPITVKILSSTSTFSWLGQKGAPQNIKSQMAKSLIFLYLKYEDQEIAKKEAKLMKDDNIFSKQIYLEIEHYMENK